MKQFNLKEYLEHPDRKVVTGDGRNVRIICTDSKIRNYPIIALVEEPSRFENIFSYTEGGQMVSYEPSKKYDLFFAPKKHQAWLNIYSSDFNLHIDNHLYASKARAEKEGKEREGYVSTGKFEWEE